MTNTNIVTVALWLYHQDLWPEFLELLKPLHQHITLHIGLYYNNSTSQIEKDAIDYFPNVRLSYYQNHGADLSPFLSQLQQIDTEFFIKIHSKKSLWGSFRGNLNWRAVLLHDLIGSLDIFKSNIEQMQNHPKIGMISNRHLLLNDRELHNTILIQELCEMIEVDYAKVAKSFFPAGNMFLSRTKLFQEYFNNSSLDKIQSKLKQEKGKITDSIKATYCHSLERVFGYVISDKNKHFSSPEHSILKILNTEAPDGYFRLVILYNGVCYLQEDLNMYGTILQQSDDTITIEWQHLPSIISQKYMKIDDTTLVKV